MIEEVGYALSSAIKKVIVSDSDRQTDPRSLERITDKDILMFVLGRTNSSRLSADSPSRYSARK